jgi:hypothetical protein
MQQTERTFYFGVIVALGIVIILLRSCQHSPKCPPCDQIKLEPVEVTAIDTVFTEKHDSTGWHKPKEQKRPEMAQKEPLAPPADQRASFISQLPNLASQIDSDWHLVRYYSDTNNLEAGKVIVDAVVKFNRLGSLKVTSDLKVKTVTVEKTVTQTIQTKPRGQVYFGIVADGSQKDLLTGFGLSSLYKTKRDKIWSASVLYDRRFQAPVFQVGTYFKLSFRN